MDTTAFPHILAAIITASASNYISALDHTTALALRATFRDVREAIDAHLFNHIAWKDGQFLTPRLHRLPTLLKTVAFDSTSTPHHPASSNDAGRGQVAVPLICKRMAEAVHILDVYSHPPANVNALFPKLAIVRCGEDCDLPPSAPTLMRRVHEPPHWSRLSVPVGVGRWLLRWHGFPSSDLFRNYREFTSSASLEEVLVVIPPVDWRSIYDIWGPVGKAADSDAKSEAGVIARIINITAVPFDDFVIRGGRVTFIYSQSSSIAELEALHKWLYQVIATRKSQAASHMTSALEVEHSPEGERVKHNVKLLSAAEWRATASDLEIDWLEREGVL